MPNIWWLVSAACQDEFGEVVRGWATPITAEYRLWTRIRRAIPDGAFRDVAVLTHWASSRLAKDNTNEFRAGMYGCGL